MSLPKLLYIQKFQVHEQYVEIYHQFVMKLVNAHKKNQTASSPVWSVYENTFTSIRDTREFIFIRELGSWADIDRISKEESLARVLVDAYDEKEGLLILETGRRAIKKITTQVISRIDLMSLQ